MTFEFKLPDIGEGVVEGEIVRWLIKPGDQITEDQPMVEVMTDKATVEIPSPVKGTVLQCLGKEGDTVEVGSTLVVIETAEGAGPAPKTHAERVREPSPRIRERKSPRETSAEEGAVLATPAVRKLARDRGIDLRQVQGTGPGGRITRQDVEAFTSRKAASATRTEVPGREGVRSLPYRGLRRKIGEHMSLSKRTAPHYTYVEEADLTELVKLRQEYHRLHADKETYLTFLPFIVQAAVKGLQKFPLLNSTLDEERGEIVLHSSCNVGIAVATTEGLVVPVVKEAQSKSLLEIAREIAELAEAARTGQIHVEDLKDGTFTITSLGSLGGILATPIINYPEVAILGVHKISPRPVVRNGQVTVRDVGYLSLSLDHRVVDGAVGAQFLQHVIRFLETPALLFLDS